MKRQIILCFFMAIFLGCACKKHDVEPETWEEFYPLSEGITRTYECTLITIDVPADIYDTAHFFLKETVLSQIRDTNTCIVFAETCEKSDDTVSWSPYASFTTQKKSHTIVRVEQNIAYKVLSFPAKTNYVWNMNIYNTGAEQQVYYSYVSDTLLEITQQDFKSLYTYQFDIEQYTKGIGLTYRQNIDVESQPTHADIDFTKPIEERITKGTIATYKLINSVMNDE